MILQALKEYYDRKAADTDSDIAPEGFEKKELQYLIVVDKNGKFVNLEDTREQIGNRKVGKTFLVPRSKTRTGPNANKTTFLLWDHFGYLLRHPEDDDKTPKQHAAWIKMLNALSDEIKTDEGVSAILKFYKMDGIKAVKKSTNWPVCAGLTTCNMSFKLASDSIPVACRSVIQDFVHKTYKPKTEDENKSSDIIFGRCLVTGECGEIAKTHGRTPINKDTKSLVALQKHSGYDSYGKEQGYNAPVSKAAEFAYVTALNTLLKSKSNRILVGDAVTVFWSAKMEDAEFEKNFGLFFDPPKDNPDQGIRAIENLYKSINAGLFSEDNDRRFFVLGLSPNAARIAIRYWKVGTVGEMAERVKQHFEDLKIVHGPKDQDYFPLFRLLVSTATQGKADNIPPNLAGDTMRAILEGLPYPQTLLGAAIRRICAEQSKKDKRTGKQLPNVTYERAALIKACLNRENRFYKNDKEKEIDVSLDITNTNIGYRLGRLFATLEKIQQEANPGINATIRDKFYGSASSTPVTVFGNLMRLKNHHLAKLDNRGRAVNLERLIGEIMDGLADFPPHLSLENQGRFAIGYYHQMQDFFTKKTDNK